jgi:hypothetical protein
MQNVDALPAVWDGDVLGGYALVLSNLALLPSIWLLELRRDLVGSAVLLGTFYASVAYHTCRAFGICAMTLDEHVVSDYLFVYRSIVYVVVSLPFRPLLAWQDAQIMFTLFFLLIDPVYFLVLARAPHYMQPLIGFALPAAVVFVYTLVEAPYRRSGKRRRFFAHPRFAVFALIAGALAGVFMYALPERFYAWAHTLWHVCSMLGAYFLIRARRY